MVSLSVLDLYSPPMFESSSVREEPVLPSEPCLLILSRRKAVPEVSRVSCLDPALMNTPTPARFEFEDSVATLIPLLMVVILKSLTLLSGSGISPNGNSPKFSRIGALEN